MALEVVLTKDAYSHTSKSFALSNTTGAYVVSTNEGGFGAPNPERSSLALFIVKETIAVNFSSLDPNAKFKQTFIFNTDPTADDDWTVPVTEDGVYGFTMVAITHVAGISSYVATGTNIYVLDTVTKKVYFDSASGVNEVTRIDFDNIAAGYKSSAEELVDKFTEEYLMKNVLESRNSNCLCKDSDFTIEAVLNAARISYTNSDSIKAQEFLNLVSSLKE